MFKKVLIANRGEIAVRVARTVQEMGVRAVGVYSDADRAALHVRCMDEAYPLAGETAVETYLRGDLITDIAKQHGLDAIHPGYGFLAESPAFARKCQAAGVAFIGPQPEAMEAVADKLAAKKQLAAAGVPIMPGSDGPLDGDAKKTAKLAEEIGFPVLVKAAAGGGGKGMRIVRAPGELAAAIESAGREAGSAFGDARVFLEKYLDRPRHVEFQIFGDSHGNAVHLAERECSVQRRYQKIVEESPSPALDAELRTRMGEAAVQAAKAIGYSNAGTVEFLLDGSGAFYFLEVNARLQVEHPVTEMTTGIDLVRAQVEVAAGGELPFSEADIQPRGHAIECRICAEDPDNQFLPAVGRIEKYFAPVGGNIRVDSGVAEGSEVSVHYDPMLAKLIVWAADRRAALERMAWALDRFVILGVTTNIDYLRRIIGHDELQSGAYDTHFVDRCGDDLQLQQAIPEEAFVVAALAAETVNGGPRGGALAASRFADDGPWRSAGRWRGI